jgi:hypothetical protein
MGVILAPIQAGKLDTWKKWVAELTGPRKAEWADFNKRYALTTHDAWLTETPMGPAVIAIHGGPGSDTFMQKLGKSTNSFDKWFAGKIKEIHGLDVSAPPPGPMPQKYLGV